MYQNIDALNELRAQANQNASSALLKAGKCQQEYLLTQVDEMVLVRSFLDNLRDFCRKFEPAMPKSVIATAFLYMKRFYLNESCMNYPPRDIGITCAYLAAKIDEFNLSIDQFVRNVEGDCRKAQKTILSNELLLMKKLKFQLTVHLPYRAKEGFMIDIRARYPQGREELKLLDHEVEEYLEKVMYTDACFLHSPSQIALAAIYLSAKKISLNLTPYFTDFIFADNPQALEYFKLAASAINELVEEYLATPLTKDQMKKLKKKLNEIM